MNGVFISYVSENIEIVDRLYQDLRSRGIQVWLDRNDIGPGLRWKREIRRAIQQGAFFIACFSKEYNERDRTYMNEELAIAIEELRQRPVDQAWFIPVKLNECEIPNRDIGGGETLRDLQYVNLYENWDVNLQRILDIVKSASSGTTNANTVEQSVDLNAVAEFVKGLTHQNRRNYERAVEHYTEALRLNPQLVEAYNNRGNAHLKKGDYDRAIEDLNTAIQLNPNFSDAYNNRGITYKNEGDFDRAIEDYTKAIDLKPDYVDAYYNRGIAFQSQGLVDRAIEDYTKAIQLKPDYTSAYINRGVTYRDKGDFDRAIEDWNTAIQSNPNLAEAFNNRGIAYRDKGDFDRAIADLNKSIELNPNYAGAYNNRGVTYSNKGDVNCAIEDYNKAIALKSNSAYYNRGMAWLRLREWKKAKLDLMNARNKELDVIASFRNDYENAEDFERKNNVKLPEDIAEMLTPSED